MKERFSLFIPARALLTSASAQLKSTGKKKSFTFAVLLVLSCLLGNNALAQNENQTTYTIKTEVKEYIDFTGWSCNGNNPNATINWDGNSIPSITGTGNETLNRYYNSYPIYVGTNPEGSTSTTITREQEFNDWQRINIESNYFANLNAGDIIRFHITNVTDDFNPVFMTSISLWEVSILIGLLNSRQSDIFLLNLT